ncbi:MAG: U32 family peptidase [Succinivibrionaceae bacterium]|nr:U32 family peptidase [Succinivibrionaceae bacterium]
MHSESSSSQPVELLSPARNLACGMAAIDSGADAVYIGGPAFGARVNAGNSIDDIGSLCRYAHQFRAKVHVALNTILSDDELREAQSLVRELYDAGADALIIQDPGILSFDLPPLEIHASTQQDNCSPQRVRFLQDIGYSQAVLPRELSLEEIRQIRASAGDIRLEFFVHGALCAGVSGRCYISQRVTGRSANRGACAQLCRVPMSLRTAGGEYLARDRYLLSLKDLNHTANLEDLLDAGIRSFKIEGRLKDEGYVRNVTAWYRARLDEIFARRSEYRRSSFGQVECSFEPDPKKSFNRGFTEYRLHGQRENFACFDSPKYVGDAAARIASVGKNVVTVKAFRNVEFHNGDKCSYFAGGELKGFRVSVARGDELEVFQLPRDLVPGMVVYRNKDADFEREVAANGASSRHLDLFMRFAETPRGFELSVRDETGAQARKELILPDHELQRARDPAAQERNIRSRLLRLGGSVYRCQELEMSCGYGWFVPVSRLNDLRHQALAELEKIRSQPVRDNARRINADCGAMLAPDRPGYQYNVSNRAAEDFFRSHGIEDPAIAYECRRQKGAVLMYCRQCLRFCFGMCPKRKPVRKVEKLELVVGDRIFDLDFDCKNCMMMVVDRE